MRDNPLRVGQTRKAKVRGRTMKRAMLTVCGWFCVALALAGAMLPVLPCTPFVLLAAACFTRSSPRAMSRLRRMPLLGRVLRDWEKHRGVRLSAKLTALALAVSAPLITFWLNPQLSVALCASIGGGLVAAIIIYRLPTVRPRPVVTIPGEQTNTSRREKLARAA